MEKEIKPLLLKKLEKMENLLKLTQSIAETLKKEDTEELLKILNARQKLMAEIDLLDSRVLSCFNADKTALIKFISNDSGELKANYNNIKALIEKTKELDDANLESINSLFAELTEDMKNLKQAENAMKGYGFYKQDDFSGAFINTMK